MSLMVTIQRGAFDSSSFFFSFGGSSAMSLLLHARLSLSRLRGRVKDEGYFHLPSSRMLGEGGKDPVIGRVSFFFQRERGVRVSDKPALVTNQGIFHVSGGESADNDAVFLGPHPLDERPEDDLVCLPELPAPLPECVELPAYREHGPALGFGDNL